MRRNAILHCCLIGLLLATCFACESDAQEDGVLGEATAIAASVKEEKPDQKSGYMLTLSIPFLDSDEQKLKQQITRIVDREQKNGRPVVVLQFVARGSDGVVPAKDDKKAMGRGTTFERSLSMARWLTGPNGVRARTIAYLPQSLEGHAVLVALACEEIAMAPLAEIGRASIDENQIEKIIKQGYLDIAERRGAFPNEAVVAMLDQEAGLFRVELEGEKIVHVDQAGLEQLRAKGEILNETQLSIPNQLGKFVGQEVRSWRWITHVARDELQLGEVLGVTQWSSLKLRLGDGPIRPAVIDIRGAISLSNVNRWLRVLNEAVDGEEANLVVFQIHSPGGSLDDSLRLATYISELNQETIQTVAWVDGEARGDAALIALAADRLFLRPKSVLGGPGEATIDRQAILDKQDEWKSLSKKTERTEGEIYSLLSPNVVLHEFLHKKGTTEIGDEELFSVRGEWADWKKGKALAFPNGMSTEEVVERRWAEAIIPNMDALSHEIGVDKLPEPKRVTPLEQWIRNLADQQWLSALLLTMALSLFVQELTTPGLGVAGFLSMLCVLFFFWMRFLNGTVEWLEILLCVGGSIALGVELFVLPGFGIFGFGGAIMLIAGIVLASQTFIVPANEYQWSKMAMSTGQIAIAMVGLFGTLYFLRKHLENLPFFRMLKLDPPPKEKAIVDPGLKSLVGKTGVITARCSPIGTALIDEKFYEVQASGSLIEPNNEVEVYEVHGHVIHVRLLVLRQS